MKKINLFNRATKAMDNYNNAIGRDNTLLKMFYFKLYEHYMDKLDSLGLWAEFEDFALYF